MLIYLAQLSHQKGRQFQNKCFPLAIGYIGAYLKQVFEDKIAIDLFKSPIEFNEALTARQPDVVMLSDYYWNEELTCAFSERIKRQYSNTLTVLGGPNVSLVPQKRSQFLKDNPSIDIMVSGDGEFIAEEIIEFYVSNRSIEATKLQRFPFTFTIVDGEDVVGPEEGEYRLGLAKNKISMEEFPSPYLTKLFDKFFQHGESPLLETNRGCPFTCTFCQQGEKYFNKVRQFPPGRFKKELNYIADKIQELGVEINTIELSDPNFGMFKRDEEICRAIRECQDRSDFPKFVHCTTGKNRADTILKNTSLVKEGSIYLRSSMQSLNTEALAAIKRENISLDTYKEIQKDLTSKNLGNIADMMLGLPRETAESHFESILTLLDTGTKEFQQYQTIILKGTKFEQEEYIKAYGIKTKHRAVHECCREYDILGEKRKVIETEEIIIGTSSMKFEEYLQCRKLHLVVMIFHNSRMLDIVYDYLMSKGIKRSAVIRRILDTENRPFLEILDKYIEETTKELFESVDNIKMFDIGDLEKYTHNKIFRHMAIAIFQNKPVVVEVVKEALIGLVGIDETEIVDELGQILLKRIIDPQRELKRESIGLSNTMLIRLFGQKISLIPTKHQTSSLRMFGKIFQQQDDITNQLIYHLRPKNTVMEISYSNNGSPGNLIQVL